MTLHKQRTKRKVCPFCKMAEWQKSGKNLFEQSDLITKPPERLNSERERARARGDDSGGDAPRVCSDGVASGKAFIRGAYTDRRTGGPTADLVSLPPSPRACSIGRRGEREKWEGRDRKRDQSYGVTPPATPRHPYAQNGAAAARRSRRRRRVAVARNYPPPNWREREKRWNI